jgi:hypothetical protein
MDVDSSSLQAIRDVLDALTVRCGFKPTPAKALCQLRVNSASTAR